MKKIFYSFIIALILNCTLITEKCLPQWMTYNLPYNGIANTLEFYNLNTGISCGHTVFPFFENIYYTTNSGTYWIKANCPSQLRALIKVQFIDATTIYACGAENVYAGSLQKFSSDFNSLPLLLKNKLIHKGIKQFYSEYKSAFIKSTNAGLSWERATQFDTSTGYIMSIKFFNANTGYALIDSNPSLSPGFYRTTNAGVNWQRIALIEPGLYGEDMNFINMNTGYDCGYKISEGKGLIYKTTNAGVNWVKKTFTYTLEIAGINFFNTSVLSFII
ncbi:MAG TPA: hypothetical protein VIK14_13450 [Ignavibacteria bacterium]